MDNIKVKSQTEQGVSWLFVVEVGDLEYQVTVAKDYWQELTDGQIPATKLVEKSFKFLLERESKEAILKEFDLKVINKYFPEYEEKIKK